MLSFSIEGGVRISNARGGQKTLLGFRPQKLTSELAQPANLLVTMGCGEPCQYAPGLRKEDWPLPDPKGQGVEAFRETREKMRAEVLELLQREGWAPQLAAMMPAGS